MHRRTLRQLDRHLSASADAKQEVQQPTGPTGWLAAVPPYFQKEGLEAFRAAELAETDVVMASYPKCGTSWLHQVLFCLLRMDDEGSFPDDLEQMLGSKGQVYPDGIPAQGNGGTAFSGGTVEKMLGQQSPRLFTTHIRRGNLPPALTGAVDPTASAPAAAPPDGGKGRLIVIARNPKDALISGYYFADKLSKGPFPQLKPLVAGGVEAAYDGWLLRTEAHQSGDGYGDYFSYYKDYAALCASPGMEGRTFWTFYEHMKGDFDAEVHRLATFLGVGLPPAKLAALRARVSIDSMADRGTITVRKGIVGDYKAHLTPDYWEVVNRMFEERLAGVAAMQPLKVYMKE